MRFNTGLLENTQVEKQYSQDEATTTGLTLGLRGGFFSYNDRVEVIAASTTALVDDDVNFVYINWLVTPAVIATQLTAFPALQYVPLYRVTTASGVITAVENWRVRTTSIKDV